MGGERRVSLSAALKRQQQRERERERRRVKRNEEEERTDGDSTMRVSTMRVSSGVRARVEGVLARRRCESGRGRRRTRREEATKVHVLDNEREEDLQSSGASGEEEGNVPSPSYGAAADVSIKRTLTDLDAVLGVDDEEEAAKVKSAAEQIAKIVNEVKQGGEKSSEESLRKEFEKLVDLLKPEELEEQVSREDCKAIKDKVFGAETFWVTETVPNDDIIGGMLFKGNLRGEVDEVYTKVEEKIKSLFPDKYEVLVIEDPDADTFEDIKGREKVCFLLLPAQAAIPPETTKTQIALSTLLGGIGILSCLQVGIGAELFMVPKEILDATIQSGTPENQENLQNLLLNYDPVPLLEAAWPISAAIFGTQVAHDVGHRIVAATKGLKLGPSYLIPNGQIGLFGSITQFKSLCKTRTDMFDIAYGGLAASGAVASALFLYGLILSMDQSAPNLVPVPSVLFQGSVLLGSLAKTFIGSSAVMKSQVMVHPTLVAGWCSMVCTALNALPIGSPDGGRIVQSAYGKSALSISAILTYAGLGFGLLGSTLSLPFGLYVLFCQRIPEQYLKNHVTGVNTNRALFAAALLLFSISTLLPMPPSDLDIMAAQNNF